LRIIAETEICSWVEQQLKRVREFFAGHDADAEMLDAVAYLLEENDRWIDPKIAKHLLAGNEALKA
jgi:hypothetical protein